ncbi:E3 ubiquitin-protein ligase WAV3-like [Tasmannia lanceolata]|uniref:E3 ubiquitin-protein ligase WAV3-like n=1 Tax=Tasmannia lanceolata TaxID=3420 RepID=UPI004064963F
MANTLKKLKKSISLRLSSSHSMALNSPNSSDFTSDFSELDLRPRTPTASSSETMFSRSSSRSSKKTCAICLGTMKAGQGHALFTAECSHSFHFSCIASSFKHGNKLCPICRSQWKEIPFQAPFIHDPQANGRARISPMDDVHTALHHLHLRTPLEPQRFDDDEPLLTPPSADSIDTFRQLAKIDTFTEFPAVLASASKPGFAVLVNLRSPPAHHHVRTPIDLVTVLDVSGSMAGTKLALLKRAISFVAHHLGPADRLAMVTFSSSARRVFGLRRMTEEGRERALLAVNSLECIGGTNILEGLRKGVRVLEERRLRNPVSSVILLSDGKDTYSFENFSRGRNQPTQNLNSKGMLDYLNFLLPSSRHNAEGERAPQIPVHTFGFGADHDAVAMHAISEVSGGTFSFIQAEGFIQDAFARCIGGLLSVVVQDLQLSFSSSSKGVSIGKIPAGNYTSEVSNRGQRAVINVGDLYADEVKDFLAHVSVPVFSSSSHGEAVMPLLSVGCTYKDPLSQETVVLDAQTVKVGRPKRLTVADERVSLEVDRQRNRLWVAEGILEAQGLAEKGDLDRAQLVLASRRTGLLASASAQAGDLLCSWLEGELREIRERMASQEMYEESGRAYMLSGLSSHSWQRATTRGHSGTTGGELHSSGPVGYETPSMANMVTMSQTIHFSAPEPGQRLHRSCSLARRSGS